MPTKKLQASPDQARNTWLQEGVSPDLIKNLWLTRAGVERARTRAIPMSDQAKAKLDGALDGFARKYE